MTKAVPDHWIDGMSVPPSDKACRGISRALRVADQIEAGQVFFNVWNTMSVQTPFGGHKLSGYGREKGSEAINHYAHLKTVTVKIAPCKAS